MLPAFPPLASMSRSSVPHELRPVESNICKIATKRGLRLTRVALDITPRNVYDDISRAGQNWRILDSYLAVGDDGEMNKNR